MVATALAVTAGVGTAIGIKRGRDAAKADKAAAANRADIARLENRREVRKQIREASVQRGQVVARAATAGGGGGGQVTSSSATGQVASVNAQLRSNLNFIRDAGELNASASADEIRASNARTQQALFSSAANAALNIGSLFI